MDAIKRRITESKKSKYRMVLGEDVYKYCKDLDDLGVKVEHLVYDFTK